MNVKVTLLNLNKLPDRPFALQGVSGKIYGHALYSRSVPGHVITLTLEDLKKYGCDIAQGFDRPLSKWRVYDVTVDADEEGEAKLADELDKSQAEAAALRTELDQCKLERDAAIRALQGRQPTDAGVINRFETEKLPETPTGEMKAAPDRVDVAIITATTAAEMDAAMDPDGNPYTPPADATRAKLEAITNHRALRKQAIEAGVPGAEGMKTRAEIIDAWLAYETPAPANG